jgi:hypothetical protein
MEAVCHIGFISRTILKIKSAFLNLSTTNFGPDDSLLWGLFCTLQNVAAPLVSTQLLPPLNLCQPKMYPDYL